MGKCPSKQKVAPGKKKCESCLPKEQASIQVFLSLVVGSLIFSNDVNYNHNSAYPLFLGIGQSSLKST